jgi:hypothetical protein
MDGERSTHEERNIHTGFWWGSLKQRDYLAELRVDVRIILKYILNKQDRMVKNEFSRFRTGATPELTL